MGQNSTEVAYSFGQMGSAYTDKAKTIVPPQNMVITAVITMFCGGTIVFALSV